LQIKPSKSVEQIRGHTITRGIPQALQLRADVSKIRRDHVQNGLAGNRLFPLLIVAVRKAPRLNRDTPRNHPDHLEDRSIGASVSNDVCEAIVVEAKPLFLSWPTYLLTISYPPRTNCSCYIRISALLPNQVWLQTVAVKLFLQDRVVYVQSIYSPLI
jgi:hypothetical protein